MLKMSKEELLEESKRLLGKVKPDKEEVLEDGLVMLAFINEIGKMEEDEENYKINEKLGKIAMLLATKYYALYTAKDITTKETEEM